MTLRFRITTEALEQLTIDELAALEALIYGDSPRLSVIRDVMAVFVVDETGAELGRELGRRAVGRLKLAEFREAAEAFAGAFKDGMLPPANADE